MDWIWIHVLHFRKFRVKQGIFKSVILGKCKIEIRQAAKFMSESRSELSPSPRVVAFRMSVRTDALSQDP